MTELRKAALRTRQVVAGAALVVCAAASTTTALASLGPVSVRVPAAPSPRQAVIISFAPRGHLPRGGYYYAVAVLTGYIEGTKHSPPPCAVSSDMRRTVYAYPGAHHRISLRLYPAASAAGEWCQAGHYEGAVYAVPHRPRCSVAQPCAGHSTEYGSCQPAPAPCVPVSGTLPLYVYKYPGGLPKPIDRAARIVGRFDLRFP